MDNLDCDGRLERAVQRHCDDGGYEKAAEAIDEQLNDLLLEDEDAGDDFLYFILDDKRPKSLTLEGLINVWLKTAYGSKWYENKVQWLLDNQPEDDEVRD